MPELELPKRVVVARVLLSRLGQRVGLPLRPAESEPEAAAPVVFDSRPTS
jgi:hypothetical protein